MKKMLKETYIKTIKETNFLLNNNCYSYKLNSFKQPINPLAWEVGHLNYFYDTYLLKYIKNIYKPLYGIICYMIHI